MFKTVHIEIRGHAALRSKVWGRCIESIGQAALGAMVWNDLLMHYEVREHTALRETL